MYFVLGAVIAWFYVIGAFTTFALAAEITLDNTGPAEWLMVFAWPLALPVALFTSLATGALARRKMPRENGDA